MKQKLNNKSNIQNLKSKNVIDSDLAFKHDQVKSLLKKNKADALLLCSYQNRLWFTGFDSTFGFLLITKNKAVLSIDARYFEAASKVIKGVEIVLFKNMKTVEEVAKQLKVNHLLIEGDYLTYNYDAFIKTISSKQTIIESKLLRSIKTPSEISKIRKVIDITAAVVNNISSWIKPGMTEIDLAKKITFELINAGGSKNSFQPIVASGPNGSVPHHHPTTRKMLLGDFVTCDFGTIYQGYCSDITRTFVVGNKPKNQRLINAYKTVYNANQTGISKCNASMTGQEVDKICRDIISKTEFADFFVHSTGHGVGIDVHELPNVAQSYKGILSENSIVTIEPGIYIPGVGGIRIEDMVLVKNKKSIWLSQKILAPKF